MNATGLRSAILFAAVCLTTVSANCFAQQRTWTDSSGTYKLEAELVSVEKTEEGFQAELQMSDGKRMAILLSQLSDEDAKIAREFYETSNRKTQPDKRPALDAQPLTTEHEDTKPKTREMLAEEMVVSRPLSAPLSMANRKLDNRNTTNVKFDPATAIRLDREIKRDEKGRPTENPIYPVEVTERQLNFLPPKVRKIVDTIRDEKVAIDVKRRAIEKLKTTWPQGRQPGLLNVLINTLSSDDKFLRVSALDLLANHDSDQSLIYIFARIDDISFDVRWRTYEVLTQLRDPRVIPELCERLEGSDRAKVASVLQVFGSTAAPIVHEWIKEVQDEDVLLNACQLLGNIGNAESEELLTKLAAHESLLVRSQARNSIKQISRRLERAASKLPSRR